MPPHFLGRSVCALFACTLAGAAPQEPSESQPEPNPTVDARLVSSRPLVRPGEWFPVVFLVEPLGEETVRLGPPDDGLRPSGDEPETDTRLNWKTSGNDTFELVPDLASIQWPRTKEQPGIQRGALTVPTRIYVPVKVVPDTPLGTAEIEFEIEGFLINENASDFEDATPIRLARTVSVEVVHPTDPEATDVSSVEPELFFGWRGTLPNWTVQDTRVNRPRKPAPALAWIVVTVPVGLVLVTLVWLFATRRL